MTRMYILPWRRFGAAFALVLSTVLPLQALGQSQPAPLTPSAVPIRPAPGVTLGPTLQKLDQNLRLLQQNPTPDRAASVTASLSSIRLNSLGTAIIVSNPLGPIQDVLSKDPTYQRNLAALAELHLTSTSQPVAAGQPPARVLPVSADGGTSNLRIVGNAAPMRRSFIVKVFANLKYVCTGVLVGQKTVLTALHCNCSDAGRVTRIQYTDGQGYTQNNTVGSVHSLIDNSSEQNAICKPDEHGSPYARYPVQQAQKGHDMVILDLQDEIDENNASAIPVIANANQLKAARVAVVSGFGVTDPSHPDKFVGTGWPPATTVALAGSVSCQDCGTGEFPAGPTPAIGGHKNTHNDTCGGDSGGPLFLLDRIAVEDGAKQGKLSIDYITSQITIVLAGITSRGLTSNSSCGDGGIYEMVGSQWVVDALKAHHVPIVSADMFVPF